MVINMDRLTVQSFHNAYITPNAEELERLWDYAAPKSLIKFYSGKYLENGQNYSLESIKNTTLWLSSPVWFNDPFDCVLNIDYRSRVDEMVQKVFVELYGEEKAKRLINTDFAKCALQEKTQKIVSDLSKRNKEIENKIYVSCFSEIENLYSVTMWSHYANNHSGFCVEYDFENIKNINEGCCLPIKYTDTHERSDNPNNQKEGTKLLLELVYTKALAWENEREWRVAQIQEEKISEGYNIGFTLPKRVYLGCKASQSLINDIVLICKERGIEIYQMNLKPGSFKLEYNKLSA